MATQEELEKINSTVQVGEEPIDSSDEEEYVSKDKQKGHKGVFIEIGERMKRYEADQGLFLDGTKPYMARLDGHKFSTFARPFRKPYDELLHAVMVQTAADLLEQFNDATTAYTQSNEITLVFPNLGTIVDGKVEHSKLNFGGKVVKLSTLMSGYCSVRFTMNCMKLAEKWPKTKEEFANTCPPNQTTISYSPERVQENLKSGDAHFDCRVFNVNDHPEFINNVRWRSNYDCERNSRTNLGRAFYSTKEMHGLKARQVVEKLKQDKNVDWNDYPMGYRYGTYIKKTKFEKNVKNPKTGEELVCMRTKSEAFSFKLDDFDLKYVELFNVKTWNEVFDQGILNRNDLIAEPLFADLLKSNENDN